jgi:hypothetical protein
MRKILICLVIAFSCFYVSGQELLQRVPEQPQTENNREIPAFRERLFFGGSFWLSVGSNTDINLSPVVGLWVLSRLAVAIGPEYNFKNYNDGHGSTNIWGGKTFVQFVVIKDMNKFLPFGMNTGIFLHLEDEFLSLNTKYWKNIVLPPKSFGMNTLLGGVGLSQQIGKRAAVNIMILWALAESDPNMASNFYSNPEFRIGFMF